MRFILALLLCFPCQAATLLRQACGSTGGTDAVGNVWSPDSIIVFRPFVQGQSYAWAASNEAALGSQPFPYSSMRATSGQPLTYTLTPSAAYNSVTLKFIEPNKTAAGQRIFSISINGSVVNPSVDLFAAAGLLKPFDLTFPVSGTGPLTVTLTPITGNAVLSGIQVDAPNPVTSSVVQCSGSGTNTTGAWNCQGLLAVTITKSDGTKLQIVGVQMTLPVGNGVTWTPLP